MDIKNITDFFRKKGVTTLQERTAFEFITAETTTVDHDDMDEQIHNSMQHDQTHPVTEEVDERVFRQAYIPKSLFEVVDPERDVDIVQKGGKDNLIYAKFLDVQNTKSQTPDTVPIHDRDQSEEPDAQNKESVGDNMNDVSDDSDVLDEDDETSDDETTTPRGKRNEDKDAKKVCIAQYYSNVQERKQKVKEEARERRKHKIPKAEKKRKIKVTKGRK